MNHKPPDCKQKIAMQITGKFGSLTTGCRLYRVRRRTRPIARRRPARLIPELQGRRRAALDRQKLYRRPGRVHRTHASRVLLARRSVWCVIIS